MPFPGRHAARSPRPATKAIATLEPAARRPSSICRSTAGARSRKLERVDDDLPARKFFRPKGSVTLGWRPAEGWDASLKLSRRVGQISFYDFLAQPKLQQDRENAGNPDLVPPQSWEVESEVGRDLGAWGKTRARGSTTTGRRHHRHHPPRRRTARASAICRAPTRIGLESTSTINFDPIGWKGAKLDADDRLRTDPRARSADRRQAADQRHSRNCWVSLILRHDIPRTQLAWGAGAAATVINARTTYLTEVFRSWEGPVVRRRLYRAQGRVRADGARRGRQHLQRPAPLSTRYVYDGCRDSSRCCLHPAQQTS